MRSFRQCFCSFIVFWFATSHSHFGRQLLWLSAKPCPVDENYFGCSSSAHTVLVQCVCVCLCKSRQMCNEEWTDTRHIPNDIGIESECHWYNAIMCVRLCVFAKTLFRMTKTHSTTYSSWLVYSAELEKLELTILSRSQLPMCLSRHFHIQPLYKHERRTSHSLQRLQKECEKTQLQLLCSQYQKINGIATMIFWSFCQFPLRIERQFVVYSMCGCTWKITIPL